VHEFIDGEAQYDTALFCSQPRVVEFAEQSDHGLRHGLTDGFLSARSPASD